MNSTDLSWRAEEACMAAWPSPRDVLLAGWLLRAAGGAIRRTNSVNPIRGGASDPGAALPAVEAVYGALGQTPLFRVVSIVAGMDEVLARRGYTAEGETLTLYGDIAAFRVPADNAAEITAEPGADWLRARAKFNEAAAEASRIYEAMLDSILLPKAFTAVREDGRIAALAYGVICNRLAVVESVVTDREKRQRGYGRRTVARLLQWAQEAGADGVCLQVVADNAPAVGLYRSLGFKQELHRYHYRRKPLA